MEHRYLKCQSCGNAKRVRLTKEVAETTERMRPLTPCIRDALSGLPGWSDSLLLCPRPARDNHCREIMLPGCRHNRLDVDSEIVEALADSVGLPRYRCSRRRVTACVAFSYLADRFAPVQPRDALF
jgi:hypothetical protein